MDVIPVPMLKDNYGYLIDKESKQAAIVDPVEPDTVLAVCRAAGVALSHVLTTHDHWDHAGGNEELVKKCNDAKIGWKLEVVGGKKDKIPALTRAVEHGDVVDLSPNLRARALHTPFHTCGHICYAVYRNSSASSAAGGGGASGKTGSGLESASSPTEVDLFTGDSLFVCGCGRINAGGSAKQLHHSLNEVIARAGPPEGTRVWVGHEYTEANLRFAAAVEPGNKDLMARVEEVATARKEGRPTVPSTLARELRTNPFLRPRAPEVRAFVGAGEGATDEDVVGALRRAKDRFGMGASAGGGGGK